MRRLALTLTLLCGMAHTLHASPTDELNIDYRKNLGWRISGAAPVAPVMTFDNGRKVFFKFREDAEIPDILAETPSGLVLLNWISEPPYVAVPNLRGAIRFRLGNAEARAAKTGYYVSNEPLKIVSTAAAPEPETAPTPSQDIPPIAVPEAPAAAPILLGIANKGQDLSQPAGKATNEALQDTFAPPPVAALEVSAVLPAAEAPPVEEPPVPEWRASGPTLRNTVEEWTRSQAGWQVKWLAHDVDYPIEVPFTIKGTYADALGQLFELYGDAERPLKVGRNEDQRLIVVTERGRKK
ncbi:TcpQ domain-containing protein [Achromobacter ruhlandii]|uniref:TcpQ domain-containing protein n=1 Tax=Achromobacter ruhlandii TaxID=72557 RepID=UPI003BA0E8F2